jgi:hypothetical protein
LFSFIGKIYFLLSLGFKIHCRVIVVTFYFCCLVKYYLKVYASRNNIKFAKMVAFVAVLDKLLSPISVPMRNQQSICIINWGNKNKFFSWSAVTTLELTSSDETSLEEQKILMGVTLVTQIRSRSELIFLL